MLSSSLTSFEMQAYLLFTLSYVRSNQSCIGRVTKLHFLNAGALRNIPECRHGEWNGCVHLVVSH